MDNRINGEMEGCECFAVMSVVRAFDSHMSRCQKRRQVRVGQNYPLEQ